MYYLSETWFSHCNVKYVTELNNEELKNTEKYVMCTYGNNFLMY